MTWFTMRILKFYFQSSNNQYMPSPSHPTHTYPFPGNFVHWAGRRGRSCKVYLTLCAYFSYCPDKKKSWGLEFYKHKVLAQCSREGKPHPWQREKLLPVSQTGQSGRVWTMGSSCTEGRLGGHTEATLKQNTQAIWEHFSCQFWMEIRVEGTAVTAPASYPPGPGHPKTFRQNSSPPWFGLRSRDEFVQPYTWMKSIWRSKLHFPMSLMESAPQKNQSSGL